MNGKRFAYFRIRRLTKKAKLLGFLKAQKEFRIQLSAHDKEYHKNISRLNRDRELDRSNVEEQITSVRRDNIEVLSTLHDARKSEIETINSMHRGEVDRIVTAFTEKESRLDDLLQKATMKETYWKTQINKLNDFMSKTLITMRQVSSRYKDLLNKVASTSVDETLLENLQGEMEKLLHTAAKDEKKYLE